MNLETKETTVQKRIDKALKLVDTTRFVIIGCGAIECVSKYLKEYFNGKTALIVADTNTNIAAGITVMEHLRSSGYPVIQPMIYECTNLYAEMQYVEQLQHHLSGNSVVPIAVGSGTINDITKLAAGRCGLPYITVPTAASMDGYTAFGASISYKGAKQTFNCAAPLVVIADINIIAAAPNELNAAGYADLIAKIPSGADWIIADALEIEPIHTQAWNLTQTHIRDLVSTPSGIYSGDKDAIIRLMEGLIMTGLGMQASKTSRPASGAEHQFSHLWDNQHHTFKGAIPYHGFKVGIGSLASEALYEKILLRDKSDFETDEKKITGQQLPFNEIEKQIQRHFHDKYLANQAIEQCKAKYIGSKELADRIRLLKSIWPELKSHLAKQLLGALKMKQMLADAGAPVNPEDIGISRQLLKLSYEQAQLIRKRYTILDLVSETGLWKTCVDPLFMKGGFWFEE